MPTTTNITRTIIRRELTRAIIEAIIRLALPAPISVAEIEGGSAETCVWEDGAAAADVGLGEAGAAVEEGAADGFGFEVEGFECVCSVI